MVFIDVKQVCKRYNQTIAVKSCDLQVGAAEILALLGPSGSGKTTLLRLIAGFEKPDEGRILISDRTRWLHRPLSARIIRRPATAGRPCTRSGPPSTGGATR